jgi:type VI secretion system protein ImpG
MTRRYFEEEMRYLQEAAKDFAEAHPEQARYLDIDSVSDRDPYVERLFEGFAFLSGRVHERLDNEMPEYTESLIQLLYPHFLKPVPALSIVEFEPEPGLVQETTVLEQGLEVRSDPVGTEELRCRFTTAQNVRLQPIQLEEATLRYPGDNTSRVRLRFSLDRGVNYNQLDLSPLRLYFWADAPTASTMHLFFTRHVSQVRVSTTEETHTRALRGQQWIRPAGLADEEGLLPYGPTSFAGFRLLQEYLCFRRRFWFVDLVGLDRLDAPDEAEAFDVEVTFDRLYPEERRFETDNVRLHCTPVVNLFETDAEPIRIDGEVGEHRVVPSHRYPEGIQTYDVQAVVGVEDATGERHEYAPFFSFRHDAQNGHSTNGQAAEQGRFYTTHRRVGPGDRPEIYLSFSDAQLRALSDVPAETLSLEVRCTNGTLPREEIKEGMINRLAPDVPNIATPRNLTQPTLIRHPPSQEQEDFFWKLISHWSMNYRSVASEDALAGLLTLYDWTDGGVNQRRRAGIQTVDWAPKEVVEHGAVLRGAEVTIEIEEGHFADEGDLCLFGLVMSRFFSMYATINSFVHLVIVTSPSERRYEWTPNRGSRPNL